MHRNCTETPGLITYLPIALSCDLALARRGGTFPFGLVVPAVLAGDLAAHAVLAGGAGAWPGSTVRGTAATVPEGGAGGKAWQNDKAQHYRPQRRSQLAATQCSGQTAATATAAAAGHRRGRRWADGGMTAEAAADTDGDGGGSWAAAAAEATAPATIRIQRPRRRRRRRNCDNDNSSGGGRSQLGDDGGGDGDGDGSARGEAWAKHGRSHG
jgi:hypothetical protein